MKISTSQYFKTMNDQMTTQQGKISKLQSQLSLGKKQVTPSTDVKATTKALKLTQVITQQRDDIANLQSVNAGYREEEAAMISMVDMIRRMQDIAVAASSETYNADDLTTFAIEVEGYMDDIRGLANSRDSNGHFMFSGTKVTTLPFTKQADGTVVYNGNQTEPKLELDTGYKLPLSISGKKLAGVIERKNALGVVTSRVDMFKVMQDFLAALKADNKVAVQTGGEELRTVSNNLGANLVDNGLRQSLVTERRDIGEDKILIYEGLLSDAQDVDYAKSITQLSSDMLALEAAQSTFAKVSQLSIFNFLR
ncbi:MAG: flagellar hook-associated protein FlgL [Gammaproteobacteria bacterium]|nr:flagellar hook-associated protein FlgL [Gammaproteobacteria bacterium]